MNTSPASGRQYLPRYNTERAAGRAASKTYDYAELMETARASRGQTQARSAGQPETAPSPGIVRNTTAKYSMDGDDILLWAPGPGCIFSGGGDGQSAYIEYTADSTPEDPVVRISGRSLSGDYVQTVHINDIDLHNATYPELCAVLAHQKYLAGGVLDNGMSVYDPDSALEGRVPIGIAPGDYTQRRDFIAAIEQDIRENEQSGSSGLAGISRCILDLLEKFREQREQDAEGERLDALLGIKDPDEGFWEARARRQEEFQALRDEQARRERVLERLRSGEPLSAAELLFM